MKLFHVHALPGGLGMKRKEKKKHLFALPALNLIT